jgi:hypothetical protein
MSELDHALERLHLCGFEYADAIPNYGPMAVEALDSLGHAALIAGLLDVYVPRLPVLVEGRPLPGDEREAARGELDRASDWLASYEQALLESPWSKVLAEAFAPTGDGLAAAHVGAHALVRLGHAVRSLTREDNPLRRRELAFALAYSAASCAPRDSAEDTVPEDWGGPAPGEAGTIGMDRLLSAVCLRGSERYLADGNHRAQLCTGVVAPSSLRFLIPHLPAKALEQVLASLIFGIRASIPLAERTPIAEESEALEVARCAQSPSEIRYRAACSVHEHSIVMAEACLREEALAPNTTLLRAAADAALRLSPAGYRDWR